MKKQLLLLLVLTFTLSSFATGEEINKLDRQTLKNMTTSERTVRVEQLNQRIEEISNIDLDSIDRSEKRALKKEVRYIHREMKAQASGGIYLSAGAVIIILLLIIIL